MCVWLVLVAFVCVGLWCFGVNMALVRKFLVLDLVLLLFGLIPQRGCGSDFCFPIPLWLMCVCVVGVGVSSVCRSMMGEVV